MLLRLIKIYTKVKRLDKNISPEYKGQVEFNLSKNTKFTYIRGKKINFQKFIYYYFKGFA